MNSIFPATAFAPDGQCHEVVNGKVVMEMKSIDEKQRSK